VLDKFSDELVALTQKERFRSNDFNKFSSDPSICLAFSVLNIQLHILRLRFFIWESHTHTCLPLGRWFPHSSLFHEPLKQRRKDPFLSSSFFLLFQIELRISSQTRGQASIRWNRAVYRNALDENLTSAYTAERRNNKLHFKSDYFPSARRKKKNYVSSARLGTLVAKENSVTFTYMQASVFLVFPSSSVSLSVGLLPTSSSWATYVVNAQPI